MTKYFFPTLTLALALNLGAASTTFAQTKTKEKSDDEKTKVKEDGVMTKTKVSKDGKVKVKGKTDDGTKVKGKTQQLTPTSFISTPAAPIGVVVGGALMTPDKNLVANAVNSTEHTTLVAVVEAAGLAKTLEADGPFTIFAPTNAAFDKLPAGTVNSLVLPGHKNKVANILSYHVVPGRITAADLQDGQTLTTVEGEQLTVVKTKDTVMLRDGKGSVANVTIPDVLSSNGVTHVVDAVLMPAK
ncbi:fasciclin domain-containing protein [Hymenobacter sp. GOD-10R]|uniref:fasciclin domain-containing protein n=1 Tax=Hymenobacter sp. GOD-10R TaxID=3093922 RepID=UPI002D7A15D5|nr:fasciclin domain-containing protein [Hymenobacter sp. GOD-10R]WRQ27133.1 fasciclin domain-containing protein [Hymenobacter sp. GOD-10R]